MRAFEVCPYFHDHPKGDPSYDDCLAAFEREKARQAEAQDFEPASQPVDPRDPPEAPGEAVYTLAAVYLQVREGIPPDLAAERVARTRHEVRHALASWAPPPDSYRSENLPRG